MKDGIPSTFSSFNKMKVSCIEIFNEKLYDLFDLTYKSQKQAKTQKTSLNLSRDNNGKTIVENAQEYEINEESEIDHILEIVNAERHMAETLSNKRSSRSHVIFRITLERSFGNPICISIVDLAGCERTKALENSRIKESVNINKSMMVLGRCIRSLASHKQAVPYRESLITRLFKDFFESPGKCAIAAVLVNVTPSIEQFEDTSFSLSFAVDASNCTTTSTNEDEYNNNNQMCDPLFMTNLALQTQKYLDNLENTYKAQVDALMERTRSANLLIANISEYVSRADYEALKKENIELRKQLNIALEKINELTKQ
ncbi:Kinesin motor domain containing protein [Histomonas meleagridis]|uniref:Kinesin motor domain containing protein n=1 Tax=Histomonas meleagridis TaxID=135588 RepID=UPI00355994F6|nr:Kinesin motor domain containing protein [Histomonas meleagridis]KAH0803128.1 Kinesin motor domain containing protein [Histomonas meleagridis]